VSPTIEVRFPALGAAIPSDHAYALYSALAHCLGALHAEATPIQIASISGLYAGNRLLHLDRRRSRLRIRLPAEQIPTVLPLAGTQLDVGGHPVRLGVPQVAALIPAPSLVARLVTIKTKDRQTTPEAFLEAARRQLAALGIKGEPAIPLTQAGPHAGQPRRRVLRIKQMRLIGYALQVTGLTAEESIRLQEHGLGGRRKMGCGFFVPLSPRGS
jgi:CRISPR-associated protein Cas6